MSQIMQKKPDNLTGYLLVLAATIIWSFNFIVARGLVESVPPVTLAFLRWAVALVIMLPFAAKSSWKARRIIWNNVGYLSVCSAMGVTSFNTLVYMAAYTSPAVNMSLIATSTPLFVILFNRFIVGEPITMGRLLGLVSATLGVIVLVTKGDPAIILTMTFTEGDLWMLLAAVLFAVYTILVRRMPDNLPQGAFLTAIIVLGLVFLLPWLAREHMGSVTVAWSHTAILAILYVGVGPSVAAFLCWNRAVEVIGPARASFVYFSLPAFSGLEAALILHEGIGWVHLVSGVLILSGIITATRASTRYPSVKNP